MLFSNIQIATLNNALETWGKHEQEQMAVGECGEFLTLFGRKVQGRATDEDFIEEIADVMVMMEQMALIYGYDQVQYAVDHKMRRLGEKLRK
jgi:NTP pyrophosphatase (non-canonical NTP hydrolase)